MASNPLGIQARSTGGEMIELIVAVAVAFVLGGMCGATLLGFLLILFAVGARGEK